jgi:hypothetical protein
MLEHEDTREKGIAGARDMGRCQEVHVTNRESISLCCFLVLVSRFPAVLSFDSYFSLASSKCLMFLSP